MADARKSIGLRRGVVRLAQHNQEWARLSEAEAKRIRKSAQDIVLDVQHVGSTAVPGLVAKPIIDITIAVADRGAIAAAVVRLTGAGNIDRGEQGKGGGHLLVKEQEPEVRLCHTCTS